MRNKASKACLFHWKQAKSLSALLGVSFLSACAAPQQPTPGNDRYMVTAMRTPFYQYGPAQGIGADSVLENGARLTLLSKSFGYSRVMLENGISGYVSTDAIGPAPAEAPVPKSTPALHHRSEAPLKSKKRSHEEIMPPLPLEQPLGLPELPSDPLPGFRY